MLLGTPELIRQWEMHVKSLIMLESAYADTFDYHRPADGTDCREMTDCATELDGYGLTI